MPSIADAAHEPRWLDYLFHRHPPAELGAWARRLRYFRFCKAIGGHANDGDQLVAALRYADAADLRHLLAQLGLPGNAAHRFGAAHHRAAPGRLPLRVPGILSGTVGWEVELISTKRNLS